MIEFVAPGKTPREMRGLASGVTGPTGDNLAEINIEHDAAEIEQQRIGGAGGEQGAGHWDCVRKLGDGSNGVTIVRLIQFADSSQTSRRIRMPRLWTGRSRRGTGLVESDPWPAVVTTRSRPAPPSIALRFDLQQRERTEDMGQVGPPRRMQIGLLEFREIPDAEQAEAPDHFVFEQFQHPQDSGFAGSRKRPALQAADADQIGA